MKVEVKMVGKQVGAASNISARILVTAFAAPPDEDIVSSLVIMACTVNLASLHFASRDCSMALST